MNKLSVILCDDEPTWLRRGEQFLRAYARSELIELELSTYESVESLLTGQTAAPDALFCDIELESGENGIDLVGKVNSLWPHCQVVYVTNFLRYAPEVYVTEHLWFVLKDDFERRLPEILQKLMRKIEDEAYTLSLETIGGELIALPSDRILKLERTGRVTRISVDDGETVEVSERLPSLLDRLPRRSFARCHGSFAVNMGHVFAIRLDSIDLDDGSMVPLSRRYARLFRERYLDWADDHAV